MKQRVNVITLGVADLSRARRFYEALGWVTDAGADDDVVFFQAGEMVVSVWDRGRLAEDSCVEDRPGWGGVTLALNVGSPAEVRLVGGAQDVLVAHRDRHLRSIQATIWGQKRIRKTIATTATIAIQPPREASRKSRWRPRARGTQPMVGGRAALREFAAA